jgi:hypothetical protein
MRTVLFLLTSRLALVSLLAAGEGAPSSYEPDLFFQAQILPIFERRCFECHSHQHDVEAGLALDSRAGWAAGGENGPTLMRGDLAKSLLIQAIRHLDDESAMPPKRKLPAIEIAMLETWVLLGAPDPRTKVDAPKP